MSLEVTQGVETASQSHLASNLERCRAWGANGEVTEWQAKHFCCLSVGGDPGLATRSGQRFALPAPALLAVRYHETWGAATYENGSAGAQESRRLWCGYQSQPDRERVVWRIGNQFSVFGSQFSVSLLLLTRR
jgi:hypothetical protein